MNIIAVAAVLSVTASLFVAPAQAQAPAAKAPAADAKKPHPCIAQVKNERARFSKLMNEGIKSGKIDKKEQAELSKTHRELVVMEKKAAEDKKMSPDECKAIHQKIVAEHKQLMAALDRVPAKQGAAKK